MTPLFPPQRLSLRVLLALLVMMLVAAALVTLVALEALERQRDRFQAHRLGPAMASLWHAAEAALAEASAPEAALATRHVTDLRFEIGALPQETTTAFFFTPLWNSRAPREARLFLPRPLLEGRWLDLTPAGDGLGLALADLAEEIATTGLHARLSLPLADGRWLTFVSPRFWQNRWTPVVRGLALVAAAMGLIVVAFALARILALPVERLAEIVSRESAGSPLPVDVPTGASEEVQTIAAAVDRNRAALAELLEDRTRMLAAISHDLRTPATRLKLRAEWIEDEGIRDKILADLDEMTVMIAAALDYLKQGSAQEEAQLVAFTSLLQAVCDDYHDLGRPVRLTEAPPLQFETVGTIFGPSGSGTARTPLTFDQARSLRLRCRPESLRRALTNLIDNALKYGGVADVMVQATSEEVIVDVLDDGPGIPEEEQGNVLRPFYRLEQSRNRGTGGTGLGLAIVKSVIDAHGGTLELSNRARVGLRARMVLPRRL
jgi:signal transduction histidine kinase